MGIFKNFDSLCKNVPINDIKVRFKLKLYIFTTISLFLSFSQVATADSYAVVCKNVTVQECLNKIRKTYSVKIETTVDFTEKSIDTVLTQESSLKAVETLLTLADVSNYMVIQDKSSDIFIVGISKTGETPMTKVGVVNTNKTKTGEDVSPEITNKANSSSAQYGPSMSIPTPEQLEVLNAKAKAVEQNIDRKIDLPGLDSSNSITFRQLIQLQEQAAERVPANDEILPMPGVPEDKNITHGQAEALNAKAKAVEHNIDRKIDLPGLDISNSITIRQLIQLQEQAAVRVPVNGQTLPMLGLPEDKK